MIIFGAGLAGLLAARRMAHHHPIIYEKQEALPNNHSALLRFRTHDLAASIGMQFKKVNVFKGVLLDDGKTITNNPTIKEYNAYSIKSAGYAHERSIINIERATRYIAPQDFINRISSGTEIRYLCDCKDFVTSRGTAINEDAAIISTIPMPELMSILEYPNIPNFITKTIWTINTFIYDCELYQTLYVPYDYSEPYRVSITGNKMTLEFGYKPTYIDEFIEAYLKILFPEADMTYSNVSTRQQNYGKIVPIDEEERQKFILWATDKYNIYSLGRYATWRQILLDDVLIDINKIEHWVTQRTGYDRQLYFNKEN